jgi:ketosteroid isomerase-like protein
MTKGEKLALLDGMEEATRLGDLDMMARYIAPDMIVHEDRGMPYGGVYRGASGFLEMIGKIMNTVCDIHIERLRIFDGDDDDIAVQIRFTGTSIATGRPFEAMTCEAYKFVDGKLAELWVWYWDTPSIRKSLEA